MTTEALMMEKSPDLGVLFTRAGTQSFVLNYREDGFGRRWAVAQSTIWLRHFVIFLLFFNDNLCLLRDVEEYII